MNINKALSIRIREILKTKKISQYELEQRTGLYHSTLSCLLNCRYNSANMKTVFLIIQGLEVSVLEFFDSPLFENLYNINLD
ncbi:MAG: helix-turn-helix transcriptional regulator [Clostridiales bacterium]|nr:helix-turn-helix transcriptional regulator [Clostridiales bacterium]